MYFEPHENVKKRAVTIIQKFRIFKHVGILECAAVRFMTR